LPLDHAAVPLGEHDKVRLRQFEHDRVAKRVPSAKTPISPAVHVHGEAA
jgi:hypothetical protein